MSEAKTQTTSVDPEDVDWVFIFESSAGGRDGSLGMVERTKAVQEHVPAITTEHTADRLIADAMEAGLLEKNGDDIRLADAASTSEDVEYEDLDWVSIFNGAAGSPESKFPTTARLTQIVIYSSLDSEEEAEIAWEDAVEAGIIVRKESGEGSDGAGMYLSDQYLPKSEEETSMSVEGSEEPREVHEAVESLRDEADSESDYIESMEGLLTDVLGRLEKVENRQDRIFDEHNQQRTGIAEIQIERLKQGHRLSRDGVDEEMLEQLGLDIVVVGDNRDVIRLADRHIYDDNGDVSSRQMPDFDSLCELEAARLKNVLGIMSRDEIESDSKQKYRAMAIWEDAELLDVTDNKDRIGIPSWKVAEKLDGIKETVYDEDKRRVMEAVVEFSDGVFSIEKGSTNKLVADKEDLAGAKQPRFEKATIDSTDGSDNTVVSSREGVNVSSTGR